MGEFFRGVLKPAPISPVPKWRRRSHENRPWRKQIAHGFLHVGKGIAGFIVLVLTTAGLLWWTRAPMDSKAPLAFFVGWWTLPVGAIIMVLTANRWAPFTIAFIFGPAIRNSLGILIAGASPASPIEWHRMPRLEAIQLFAYALAVVALTWRFLQDRPAPTTFLDRIALTVFAIASLQQFFVPYHVPPIPLLSGMLALLIAWVAYRLQHLRRKARRRRITSPLDTAS